MTESEKIIIFELEQALYQVLKENFKEKSEPETNKNPFIIRESKQIEKERLIKRWKQSEGFYYLNPEKFQFNLRDL